MHAIATATSNAIANAMATTSTHAMATSSHGIAMPTTNDMAAMRGYHCGLAWALPLRPMRGFSTTWLPWPYDAVVDAVVAMAMNTATTTAS